MEFKRIQDEINRLEMHQRLDELSESGLQLLTELRKALSICSSCEKLKDKNTELSDLAKDFINEVDKKHPFVNLPEEEEFYTARHKLAERLKSDL